MLEEKNPDAISILYDKYASAIFGAICSEVEDVQVAEKILEESFIYIWDNSSVDNLYTNHLLLWMLIIAKRITSKKLDDICLHNNISKIILADFKQKSCTSLSIGQMRANLNRFYGYPRLS